MTLLAKAEEGAPSYYRGISETAPGHSHTELEAAYTPLPFRTASQRADMMNTFPDPANMATDLVRALVDALRESGRNNEANAILAHRFSPRKEGEVPFQPQK